MNTDTGQIYRGLDEIKAALERGEPVVPVSERVAQTMEAGQRALGNRKERRQAQREERRQERKARGVRRI